MSFDSSEFPFLNPATDRRVAIITGGNSGVGFYTVLQLYLHGYIVYIAGRSKSRCQKSIKELKKKAMAIRSSYSAEQASSRYRGDLHFLEVDLSVLNSVVRAVETFKSMEDHLHILVNNAGAMALPYSVTCDNFEILLQTNYISPFLLTTKLLPMLEKTGDKFPKSGPPRIVYLSSVGHQLAFSYFKLSNTFNYRPNFVFTWLRYGMAKTAGIHFMKMLALRNPKILCMTVHPGLVMNANLFTYFTRLPLVGLLFWCMFQIFGYFFGVTSEEGARAVIKCTLDPQLRAEDDNGKYFGVEGKEAVPSSVARNMDYAARTWIWTIHQLNERGFIIPTND
ncbi:uncharacterized protein SPAPADRAFT_50071 [Spathaspora passalidarum NRRL Y-27907]|uniref:NAD(P)-binding protein n=1 Tax=Spathaspora passalidarum (strain NRRL Y-27907 / 11-Y1) TaxID=619300 RepID=G3ALB5_SPAPN|nr:uncharacterized protein SPAPADRAFT_50071 [Spathaspora passalidarum NRRL Y-27907]EGW33159.1 hypothetical protein SPAPADRAFT_50071 [Spathaspora passalidarum NRRL Y-27907]